MNNHLPSQSSRTGKKIFLNRGKKAPLSLCSSQKQMESALYDSLQQNILAKLVLLEGENMHTEHLTGDTVPEWPYGVLSKTVWQH